MLKIIIKTFLFLFLVTNFSKELLKGLHNRKHAEYILSETQIELSQLQSKYAHLADEFNRSIKISEYDTEIDHIKR